ncbi:adventurous gliding motility protein CglE [Vulgatibacter incomptus]|uniref:Outer membrane protein beta-barrel domain-containing protein n=1 Tax=Vulgatibacter incomptus TaxID=1391653 RepID=A0A0K1PAM6_9BACT|nr:adventurous gliding motility protein CglE [Vulgatibacter incomptus]AKU90570.1 hypothetical protein AKJ08_0957 [Vulgatibacter incomptus]
MKLLRSFLSVAVAAAVLVPALASAETPLSGVPTKIRRGFFTETNMGAFFTVGGDSGVSNAQVYLQLGVGYDLLAIDDHFLAVGVAFSQGASSGTCYGNRDGTACLDSATGEELGDNWSAQTLEASVVYGYQVAPRLLLTARGLGGAAFLEPMAFSDTKNPVPLMGGGIGAEYATQFDHFSLGLDVTGKYFLGPNVLGLAIAPRVKYTF